MILYHANTHYITRYLSGTGFTIVGFGPYSERERGSFLLVAGQYTNKVVGDVVEEKADVLLAVEVDKDSEEVPSSYNLGVVDWRSSGSRG